MSALETHGKVEGLLANESRLPIGEVLEPPVLEKVRAVFRRLVGAQTLERFDAAGEDETPEANADAKAEAKVEAKAEAKAEGAAGPSSAKASSSMTPEGLGVKAGLHEESKVVGQKRLARMAVVDDINDAVKTAKTAPAAANID